MSTPPAEPSLRPPRDGEPSLRPRRGGSARSSLLTVLGEFVLNAGGEVWTSTLIDALGRLGFSEQNARQAAARLHDQGFLERASHGRRTRWLLSPAGRRMLLDGERRIYEFLGDPQPWDGQWLLVLSSLPDAQRSNRHQLRRKLGFLGFGTLTPGVMISPHTDREALAAGVLTGLGLDSEAFLLKASGTELGTPERMITSAWDLPALANRYRQFVEGFDQERPSSGAEAFVALAELVDTWRRFPFEDPEIPPELLGENWLGQVAKASFDHLHQLWSPAAQSWFTEQERNASR